MGKRALDGTDGAGSPRGEAGRQAVLEAAMEEFAEHGLEGARTRSIAQRAAQNLATLHYHFGSKEGLYRTLVGAMVGLLRPKLEARWAEAARLLGDPPVDPAAARAEFEGLLDALFTTVVADERTVPLSRILIREQMRPTAAFEIFYEGLLGPLHTTLTDLLGAAIGRDATDPEVIAQTHALLGQVFIFRAARATILRRTGWEQLGFEEAAIIRRALHANLDALFRGLPPSTAAPNSPLR